MSDRGDCRTAPATPGLLKMGANQEKTGQSESKQFKLEENWVQWDKTGQNGSKLVKMGPPC